MQQIQAGWPAGNRNNPILFPGHKLPGLPEHDFSLRIIHQAIDQHGGNRLEGQVYLVGRGIGEYPPIQEYILRGDCICNIALGAKPAVVVGFKFSPPTEWVRWAYRGCTGDKNHCRIRNTYRRRKHPRSGWNSNLMRAGRGYL